jgi:iron complex outermembrane receptor protein
VSLAVDYWNIRKRNVITVLPTEIVYENYDVYGDTNLVRGPPDPLYPGLPGPIVAVIGWNQNVGNNATSGVDVSLRAVSEPTRAGRFTASLEGTYVIDWTEHLNALAPQSVEGGYLLAPVPRWRHYVQLTWEHGAWSATLAQRHQSGYTDGNPTPSGEARRVGTYSLVDLQGAYRGFGNTTVALGVRNLFDRNPPFTNVTGFHVGYDPAYGDPRGRTFYARVSHAFR